MLKSWLVRAACAVLVLFAASAGYLAGAQGAEKPNTSPLPVKRTLKPNQIARVGERIVTAEQLLARIYDVEQGVPPDRRNLDTALHYLVHVQLLELEAERIGCELKPSEIEAVTKQQYDSIKKHVHERFAGALTWDEWLKQQGMTDEGFKRYLGARARIILLKRLVVHYYFDYHDSLECAHILVERQKTAEDIIAEVKKGVKFEDLAVKHSQDISTAQNGGRLPRHFKGDGLAKEIENKLWTMSDGEVAGPVQSAFGWHVVRRISLNKGNKARFFDRRGELLARADVPDEDRTGRNPSFNRWVSCVMSPGDYKTERRLPGLDVEPDQP